MAPREMVTCTHGHCCLRRAHVLLVSDSEQTLLLVRPRLRVLDGGREPQVDPAKVLKAARAERRVASLALPYEDLHTCLVNGL